MFKRHLSIFVLVLFSILLVACKKDPKPPVDETDTTKPLITVPSTPLKHLQGDEINLLEGITVIDNVDGVLQPELGDLGGYDKNVVGEYTVTIKATDKAGNVATAERKVIVEAGFARVEFNGRYIKAKLNPQINAGYTNTGYNTAYDTTYVNVLTTDYVRHILNVAPERLGANTGWSIIYIADKNGKLTYARDFLTNEFWIDEDGYLQTKVGNDWCTGTPTSSNAKYCSSEMGLGLANIEQHLEEDGHVFLFLNSGTNSDGTPRYFAASHILSHEENMKGLGETIKIAGLDLSEYPAFDKDKTFPIIKVPAVEYVDTNKVQRLNTRKTAYVGDPVPNLLNGVTATDGNGKDITSKVTYKVYEFVSSTEPKGEEVSIDDITKEENAAKNFLVVYEVTENGFTDEVSIILEVKGDRPDQLEVDEGDTLFSVVLGDKIKLDFNNAEALKSTEEKINMKEFDHGQIFTKEAFLSGLEAAKTTNAHNGEVPFLNHGVVVIMDRYYGINKVRVSKGGFFEIDAAGKAIRTNLTWGKTVDVDNGGGILAGLEDVIPEGGYVIVYPETETGKAIDFALTHFYDKAYVAGEEIDPATVEVTVKYPVQVNFEHRIITNVESFVIGEAAVKAKFNDSNAFYNGGSGANMRLAMYNGFALVYDKEGYEAGINLEKNKTSNAANGNLPLLSNGAVAIFDEDWNLVVVRMATQSNDHRYEVYGDGTFKTNDSAFKWNAIHGNVLEQNGLLRAVEEDIPEGGYVVIFPNQGTSEIRDFAYRVLFNKDYKSGGLTTNPEADNKDTNYFGYNEEYYQELVFEYKEVMTDIPKPARVVRPKVTFENESTIKWAAVENADKYALYVNGVLVKGDITELEFDLSTVITTEGKHTINLRALSSDLKKFSNSVLSNALTYEVKTLATPDVTLTEDTITWEAVEGADHYVVYADGEKIAEVEELTLDLSTIILYPTEYDITVVAVSNAKNVLKSLVSDAVVYSAKAPDTPIKLETPVVKVEDGKLIVTPVKYASFYQVFDGEILLLTLNTDNLTVELSDIVLDSGNFTLSIKAIAKEEETYLLPSDAVTIETGEVIAKLKSPTNFRIDGAKVMWDPVPNATSYDVYINDEKVSTVTGDLFVDTSVAINTNVIKVVIVALPANEDYLPSEKAELEVEVFMTIEDVSLRLFVADAEYYLTNRNDAIANVLDIYYVTNPYEFVLQSDLTGVLTAYATLILVDSEGKVKLVRTILNHHEWLSTNDSSVNNGWRSGSTLYNSTEMSVASIKAHIDEGDKMFIAKATGKQPGVSFATRDFLAYYYQVTWTLGGTEGWRGDVSTFHNPKDVTYTIERKIK